MPANTPRGLPYPLPTEPVAEGAQAIRNLAEAIDLAPRRIAQVVVGANVPTIDFANIPQTFENLALAVYARSDNAAAAIELRARFNDNAAVVYAWEIAAFVAGAAAPGENLGQSSLLLARIPGLGSPSAGSFGQVLSEITAYRRGGHKMITSRAGAYTAIASGGIRAEVSSGVCTDPAAIAKLTLLLSAGLFVNGSVATLYGLP